MLWLWQSSIRLKRQHVLEFQDSPQIVVGINLPFGKRKYLTKNVLFFSCMFVRQNNNCQDKLAHSKYPVPEARKTVVLLKFRPELKTLTNVDWETTHVKQRGILQLKSTSFLMGDTLCTSAAADLCGFWSFISSRRNGPHILQSLVLFERAVILNLADSEPIIQVTVIMSSNAAPSSQLSESRGCALVIYVSGFCPLCPLTFFVMTLKLLIPCQVVCNSAFLCKMSIQRLFVYFRQVNSFVGAFHDAVILYALALNETLAAGFNATDGAEITKRMWNKSFEGLQKFYKYLRDTFSLINAFSKEYAPNCLEKDETDLRRKWKNSEEPTRSEKEDNGGCKLKCCRVIFVIDVLITASPWYFHTVCEKNSWGFKKTQTFWQGVRCRD